MICGNSVQWQSTAHALFQPLLACIHTASSRGLPITGRVNYVWMLKGVLADIQIWYLIYIYIYITHFRNVIVVLDWLAACRRTKIF